MTFKTLMMSTALVSLLAAPAISQQTAPITDPATNPAATDPTMTPTVDLPMTIEEMTVDQFIGLDVMSANGEDVGEIDYVIGTPGGAAEVQAVIGIGGFLGLGEYTVALPISAFDFDSESRNLIVNQTEDQLRATPEFDESGAESVDGVLLMSDLMGNAGTDDASGATGTTMEENSATESDTTMENSATESDSTMEDSSTTGSGATVDSDADAVTNDDAGTDMDAGADADADAASDAEADTESDAEVETDTETNSSN